MGDPSRRASTAELRVGLVINPRGTSGAGKTWLVREIMAAYRRAGAEPKAIMREGRSRPFGWRLSHPRGGRTLAVIGDYQATRGGTDTIPKTDGGLDQAFRLTQALADDGHDVVLEGYQLSGDHAGTAALAEAQARQGRALHVLCLDVPLEQCVRNVVARRRARQGARPAIERTARAGQEALREACTLLRQSPVTLEWLDAASALERSLALLGLA